MEKGEKSDFSPAVSSRNVTGARHSSSSQGGQPNRSSTSRPRSSSLPSERLVTPVPSTPSEPRESTHQPPSRTPSKNLRSLSIRLSRRLSASAKGVGGSDDSPRSEVKKPVAARRVKRRFGVGEEETTSEEGWQSDGEELDRRKVHRFSDHGHPFMSSVGQSRDSSMMSVSQQMTIGLDYFSIPPDPNGKNNFRRSMPPLGYDSLLQPSPFLGSSTPCSRQPSPNNTLAVRRNGTTPPPSSFLSNAALKRNNTWGHHVDQTWSDKNYLPSFTELGPSSYGPYIPRDSSQRELLAYSPTSSNPPSGGVTPLNPSSPMLLARTGSSPFLEPMLTSKPTTMKEKVASVDLLKRSDTLERLEREKKAILGKVDTSDDVSKPYITSSPKATPKKEGILKGGKNASRPATGDSDISVISNSIADDGASASNASGSHDLLLLKDPQPSTNRVQFVDQPRLRVPSFPSIYSPRNPLSIQSPAKAHTPSSVLNSSDALSFNPFSLPPLSLERPSSSSTASVKLLRRPGRSSSESFAGPGQTGPFMAPFHTGKTVNSLGSLVSTVEREHSVPALGRQNLLLTNPDPPSTPTPTPDTLTRFHRKSTSTS
ncbi:hypothetical protein BT69DRAFT_1276434 [Atractiella rhizophila]|nr:hypothetical protein BT69DRAFT_1276434 [Atractiella rhizophila]